eukprot:TRINITY_DN16987_c0_g2_i1.p1 TRINITY_DN16987_c0_g2~~TRINITY_DN16987_c0_g2_i1.p1  ORF type:complete len:489 (-),score=53.22 TRINITY_DN16987_c0_g2_i1:34-1500(-)
MAATDRVQKSGGSRSGPHQVMMKLAMLVSILVVLCCRSHPRTMAASCASWRKPVGSFVHGCNLVQGSRNRMRSLSTAGHRRSLEAVQGFLGCCSARIFLSEARRRLPLFMRQFLIMACLIAIARDVQGNLFSTSNGMLLTSMKYLNSCYEFRAQQSRQPHAKATLHENKSSHAVCFPETRTRTCKRQQAKRTSGDVSFYAAHPGLSVGRRAHVFAASVSVSFGGSAAASLMTGTIPSVFRPAKIIPGMFANLLLQACPGDAAFAKLDRDRPMRLLLALGVTLYKMHKFLFVVDSMFWPMSSPIACLRMLLIAVLFLDGSSLLRCFDRWLRSDLAVNAGWQDLRSALRVTWCRNVELILLLAGLTAGRWILGLGSGPDQMLFLASRMGAVAYAGCCFLRRVVPLLQADDQQAADELPVAMLAAPSSTLIADATTASQPNTMWPCVSAPKFVATRAEHPQMRNTSTQWTTDLEAAVWVLKYPTWFRQSSS